MTAAEENLQKAHITKEILITLIEKGYVHPEKIESTFESLYKKIDNLVKI
jgi:hypothetical protein